MSRYAILLCAGKGTRMNDDGRNKVAFDCAGVPVIRRIAENMRQGGVERFVVVVGHKAQTVMDALDGIPGIVYVYQSQQNGTGHAALCGLNAVPKGSKAIISMGDKIIAPEIIKNILKLGDSYPAVWSVQPVEANPGGGRVVVDGDKPCGVVELADAAAMTLEGVNEDKRFEHLRMLGLNEKKARAVLKRTEKTSVPGTKVLCGREFSAEEILSTPYANAGLYCFDAEKAVRAISQCTSNNAQGEIYLTDTLEYFAKRNEVAVFEVKNSADMLTFSTKSELRKISRGFMKKASEFSDCILRGVYDGRLEDIYGAAAEGQRERYACLLSHFISVYGDRQVVLTRSPGRINLMGRHIDHRGGSINVIATNNDTLLAASLREDDTVNITNVDPSYPNRSFSIGECYSMAEHESWMEYLEAEPVKKALADSRGDWVNYVKGIFMRLQQESNMPLCGMDIAVYGNIPPAAGLSSSSSIVVAAAEAVVALNSMIITDQRFVELCGEGEWFVGSRGGAGDHAAMKTSKKNRITHLSFKPFKLGAAVDFSDKYVILGMDSGIKANKSMGSRDKFNSKVAAYEIAFMLIKQGYPGLNLHEFRDLAKLKRDDIYKILLSLPEKATREEALKLLPNSHSRLRELFNTHADIESYDLRGVTLYGISECIRAEKCMEVLEEGDYKGFGEMMKISHDGDRIDGCDVSDSAITAAREQGVELMKLPGAYGCSTREIDLLCDLLCSSDGVLGSALVGAGLGGCVIALCEKDKAQAVMEKINVQYYDKYDLPRAARIYMASSGSAVIY